MGSGIAAHLANLGFHVSLLDLTPESVATAMERARKARPPHFMIPAAADRIRLGSIAEDLDWVREADWVCEAVVEKLDVKRALFAEIEPLLRADAMISTNTSGLQISLLSEGRSDDFRRRFHGTHFFNPPRYLKLLELIPTDATDPMVIDRMTRFLEDQVARRVVVAKDTPGFIANRFGMWAMIHAIHVAEKLQLSVEQVDAITGPFLGRPRSASFRLNDLVGIDIMQDIARNLYERCGHDPHRASLAAPPSMAALLERGWIGEKAGQGYYRREGKEFLALDLVTLAYRPRQEASFPALEALAKLPLGERIARALELRDEAGEFLREHLVPVLRYADYLKAEISHSVEDFDRVMMWGFGWEQGPFAMIDGIGPERLGIPGPAFYAPEGLQRGFDGSYIPRKVEPQYRSLTDYPVVERRNHFNVRDLGDGVTAIGVTTKMGVFSPALVRELTEFLASFDGPLVLAGEAKVFSAGFDLKFLIGSIEDNDWPAVEEGLRALQQLSLRMGELRAVAAIHGMALGGGFEVAMGCPAIAALAETQIGFPEAKVGLFPSGSGTARMRLYFQDDLKTLLEKAMALTLGVVATNADEAREMGFLAEHDVTVYHPDRLMVEAKRLALGVMPREAPTWKQVEGPLGGMIDRRQQELKAKGELTDHDEKIGDKIKAVFTKSTSFADALARERTEFAELMHNTLTQARIRHMLESGKPLKN